MNRELRPAARATARDKDEDFILWELHQRIDFEQRAQVGNVAVEKAVLECGQFFLGIQRPKQFRKRKEQNCFGNAADLALNGRGIYVEGFATVSFPIGNQQRNGLPSIAHHAWITLDGCHAIDVTWRADPADCRYFGIPFSQRVLERWIARRWESNGNYWGPLLDWSQAPFADLLRDIQSEAAQFFGPNVDAN